MKAFLKVAKSNRFLRCIVLKLNDRESYLKMVFWDMTIVTKSLPTQKQKKFYNVSAQLGMALNTKILKNYKNVMAATKL